MKISDFLSPDRVFADLRAPDKARLLRDLSERGASALNIDATSVLNELQKRESLGSTGMGGGIALPHARLAQVDKPFGLLARLRSPLPFDAIDGRPIDIVFAMLLPAKAQGDQIQALATAARCLRNPVTLAALRQARDAAALYAVIARSLRT